MSRRHHTFGERKIKSFKQGKNMVPWFMATSSKKKIVPSLVKLPVKKKSKGSEIKLKR